MVITDPFAMLSREFDKVFAQPVKASYPPYNVIKDTESDRICIEFAVAGFAKNDISIEVHKGVLHIKGEQDSELVPGLEYVHKGIAARKFTRSFSLPEYTEVESATVEDGILSIWLIREIPEEEKPKAIEIKQYNNSVPARSASQDEISYLDRGVVLEFPPCGDALYYDIIKT